jgi:hypothetical protein
MAALVEPTGAVEVLELLAFRALPVAVAVQAAMQ